jgi:hypothetical protein
MISLGAVVTLVLYLIVAGLIFWLLWWLIDYCAVPEPFNKIARIVLAVLAVLVVISLLLSLVGGVPLIRP